MAGEKRIWLSNTHGLRISKDGYDVRTANAAQLAFDSDRSLAWLYFSGSATIAASTTSTLTFPETLSEPPITFATARLTDGGKQQLGTGLVTYNGPTSELWFHAQILTFRDKMQIWNGFSQPLVFDYAGYRIT